ncbi:murein DD-endopeptidase MepM [Orbaceae bacterium ESL0721]|nr:murein DD-endopeptidase MepM [Orbaceae bacterium ESL0721]
MARLTTTSTAPKNVFFSPFFLVVGLSITITLLLFLWRPLNLDRTTYLPLTPQAETTVIGKVRVEIIDDKAKKNTSSSVITDDSVEKEELEEIVDEKENSIEYTVTRGDTLHDILLRYNVNYNDIYQLTNQFKQLANLRIGQQISWTMDDNHNLQTFSWVISSNNIRLYERSGNRFIESTETAEAVSQNVTIQGEIKSSFTIDARKSGLTNREIDTITKTLQWQLDFRKLQPGDKFVVLLSREMHGKYSTNSQILGVRIKNSSKDYYAILADDGSYYDINGMSLSQSFLRYPLSRQAPVSSPFNPKRLHPVTGAIAPHNGVDFAVSRGTTVLAVGDGEVVIAKYSESAGYYIAIRHGRQYLTKYMHLDKLLVKTGQQIKRGDKIALSGNTGRSTGPHLHFELHINGRPVNPLKAKLPISEGLTGKSKSVFVEKVKSIKPQLTL